MTAYLKFAGQDGAERRACGTVTTIGRDRSNDIVLPDLRVSRHHAMVRRLGGDDYYLIDSGSANGSRINNRRINSPTRLGNADRIIIGGIEFEFEQAPSSAGFSDSLSFQQTVILDAPQIQEITVLVADLRDFTGLSECLPIQTLTRLMSKWFQQVSEAIESNCGNVDKFIGDCVFARWESNNALKNVMDAIRTAGVLRTITDELAATFPEIREPLRIGVGINTGMASLGVGSDNTALGDAVNTAFRLEAATKALGADVVLSENAYSLLPEHFWREREAAIRLKGKRKPVKVVGVDFEWTESVSKTMAKM